MEGAAGNLESTIPPLTFPAWLCLATGQNPGKLGIYSFVEDYETMTDFKIVNAQMVKAKKIWNLLDDHGGSSCILNMPGTYPPDQLNGVMVSGAFVPPKRRDYAYPRELVQKLEDMGYYSTVLEDQKIGLLAGSPNNVEQKRQAYEAEFEKMKKLESLVRILAEQAHWDLFFILFDGTDRVQHLFWDDQSALLEYYSKIDNTLHDIVDMFAKDHASPTIFIASDHGFHSFPTLRFSLSAWLEAEGFARRAPNRGSLLLFLGRVANSILKKVGVDLGSFFPDVGRKLLVKSYNDHWSNQEVKPSFFGIFVNKNLGEEARSKIVDSLMTKLRLLTYESEAVFQQVLRREDVYSGEHLSKAPDVVFLTKQRYFADPLDRTTKIFSQMNGWPAAPHVTGHHTSARRGILIVHGPHIKPGKWLPDASIMDVAPTILHTLGLSVPADMDGRVLSEIFAEDSEPGRRPVIVVAAQGKTAQEKERLARLIPDLERSGLL